MVVLRPPLVTGLRRRPLPGARIVEVVEPHAAVLVGVEVPEEVGVAAGAERGDAEAEERQAARELQHREACVTAPHVAVGQVEVLSIK